LRLCPILSDLLGFLRNSARSVPFFVCLIKNCVFSSAVTSTAFSQLSGYRSFLGPLDHLTKYHVAPFNLLCLINLSAEKYAPPVTGGFVAAVVAREVSDLDPSGCLRFIASPLSTVGLPSSGLSAPLIAPAPLIAGSVPVTPRSLGCMVSEVIGAGKSFRVAVAPDSVEVLFI
jgi:hypothetical protein